MTFWRGGDDPRATAVAVDAQRLQHRQRRQDDGHAMLVVGDAETVGAVPEDAEGRKRATTVSSNCCGRLVMRGRSVAGGTRSTLPPSLRNRSAIRSQDATGVSGRVS